MGKIVQMWAIHTLAIFDYASDQHFYCGDGGI